MSERIHMYFRNEEAHAFAYITLSVSMTILTQVLWVTTNAILKDLLATIFAKHRLLGLRKVFD